MNTEVPKLQDDQAARLADGFRQLGYSVDEVLDRLGAPGQDGLLRNSTMPARNELADAVDAQADLIRLFVLQQSVPAERLAASLRTAKLNFDELVAAGLLAPASDTQVQAVVDVRPYGFEVTSGAQHSADQANPNELSTNHPHPNELNTNQFSTSFEGWIVSDHQPDLDFRPRPTRPDYVLGVNPASTTLAQLSPSAPVSRALDLGTGCGVQSLHLSTHAEQIVATDLNPRALALAELTMQLNGVEVDLRLGDLYQPVQDEKFDLIVTNPPFVIAPPSAQAERLLYREGSLPGDQLVERVVRDGARRLRPGGVLQVLANWANDAIAWQERLADWALRDGFNLWAIERERLDPYAYIEMWLADAGLAGTDQWEPKYRQWLAYFDQLGIEGVSMGWLTISPILDGEPDIELESWPHQVAQPVGDLLASRQQRVQLAGATPDAKLAARWRLADDVVQETMGQPGAADPEYVVLRQSAALKRAMQVDTAFGAILGACDGELPLGVIIEAVAQLVDEELDRAEMMRRVDQAILDGYLLPA